MNGNVQSFSDQSAPQTILRFVTAAAAAGATGIGAGVNYMGRQRIHVGFGLSPSDPRKLTWGAQGQSINAPQWLRDAAHAGWNTPTSMLANGNMTTGGERYTVVARSGLKLRGGPGTDFPSQKTLPLGTELTVVDFDEGNSTWVRVDLEGEGLIDGYVFAAFLAKSDEGSLVYRENVPEPENYD